MDTTTFRFQLQAFLQTAKLWIASARRQDISLSDNNLPQLIERLENVIQSPEVSEIVTDVMNCFELFMEAFQKRDYVLAADYMQEGIVAPLEQVVAQLVLQWEVPALTDGYQIEYTSSAMTTIAKERDGKIFYLHTNCCPIEEAYGLREKWVEEGVQHYIVAGLGLGYHVVMLARNPLVQVDVYEEDKQMIELAKEWCDTPELWKRNNVNVIHDPGYIKFSEAAQKAEIDEKAKTILYYPSVQTIRDDRLRQRMNDLFIQMDNATRWSNFMRINFDSNQQIIPHEVGELKSLFQGKTLYLIAGGPSLDNNIMQLKNRDKESVVLTVGTSLRRCIKEEVEPDCAIITDPKNYVYTQIKGIEECNIPLILLSTAYALLARNYKGKKYIAYQEGYHLSEKYAKEHGYMLFEVGSSVMTTALDLCIRMEAKKVVFLGLDLAFTDGKSHQGVKKADMTHQTEQMVEDIYGNRIGTSKNLDLYRKWIEERIERAKRDGCPTEFIDASEGGAKIAGTTIMKLKDVLEHEKRR